MSTNEDKSDEDLFLLQCRIAHGKLVLSGRDPTAPEDIEKLKDAYFQQYGNIISTDDIKDSYIKTLEMAGLLTPPKRQIEVDLIYETRGASEIHYVWKRDGVFQQKVTAKAGVNVPSISEVPELKWKSIELKVAIENLDPYDEFYDIEIDGHLYRDQSIDEIFDRLYRHGHVCTPRAKIPFPWMFSEVIRAANLPRLVYTSYCGFTSTGWIMPGDSIHRVKFEGGIQEKQRALFEALIAINPDEQTAKEQMQAMIDKTNIDHKLQFIASAIITPFMFSMIGFTQFIPIIAARSFKPHTGKTQMMLLGTWWMWGVPGEKALKPDTIHSESRFGDYFTLSTFGNVVDDAQDISPRIQGTLKVMYTGIVDHQRKRIDHTLGFDRPLTTPLKLTYNRRPGIFTEPATLDRLFEITVETEATPESQAIYNDLLAMLKPGVIGRYIIEKTKDWKLADILRKYNQIEDMPGNTNPRSNVIYKFQVLGAWMLEEFFGIKIDQDAFKAELCELIEASKIVQFNDVLSLLHTQVTDVDIPPIWDEDHKHIIKDGHKRARWIDNEVLIGDYRPAGGESMSGWMYRACNYEDLKKNCKDINLPKSLEDFADIVKQYLPEVHYGTHTPDGPDKGKVRSIYIPVNVEWSCEASGTREQDENANKVLGDGQ